MTNGTMFFGRGLFGDNCGVDDGLTIRVVGTRFYHRIPPARWVTRGHVRSPFRAGSSSSNNHDRVTALSYRGSRVDNELHIETVANPASECSMHVPRGEENFSNSVYRIIIQIMIMRMAAVLSTVMRPAPPVRVSGDHGGHE